MLTLCFRLAAAINGHMAYYMPTNRLVRWLRSPACLKWAIPIALAAATAYLLAMRGCMTIIDHGGPAYLNVLVGLFAWNTLKFVVVGMLAPLRWFAWRFAPADAGPHEPDGQNQVSAGLSGDNRASAGVLG